MKKTKEKNKKIDSDNWQYSSDVNNLLYEKNLVLLTKKLYKVLNLNDD